MNFKKFNEFDTVNENSNEDIKEYIGFWSTGSFSVTPGYGDSQGSEYQIFHGEDDLLLTIHVDSGYSEEEVKAVSDLSIGEVWKSNHYGTSHMVLRTK
jgi:hypothetical protein